MTSSESKALKWLKKRYFDAYIKKMPDYKQTGSGALRGLPDYLIISKGFTFWFEVKMVKSKKTFNFNEINEYQWVEFSHMLKSGADISVLVLDGNNNWHCYRFENLSRRAMAGETTISFVVDDL